MSGVAPITVTGLNHAYGKGSLRKQILFDITTEIPEGEIVIVTGPSGSGKTTLLTLVGALRSAQDGSVRVLGEELRGAPQPGYGKGARQAGADAVASPGRSHQMGAHACGGASLQARYLRRGLRQRGARRSRGPRIHSFGSSW